MSSLTERGETASREVDILFIQEVLDDVADPRREAVETSCRLGRDRWMDDVRCTTGPPVRCPG